MMENCYIVESSAIPVTSTESHALTCAIFDATPVPFAINDQYGRIVMLNRAFVETIGYTLEDIPTLSDWWPLAYPDAGYRQWVTDNWQKKLIVIARVAGSGDLWPAHLLWGRGWMVIT
jgi:PAS domain-containing protein